MAKEGVSNGDDLQQYLGLVHQAQRAIPDSVPRSLTFPVIEPSEDPDEFSRNIQESWDGYAKDYVRQESQQAHAVTMMALLDHLKPPQGNEKWLSLGSGPGLYELFFAMKFPGLDITSLDLSPAFIRMQKERLFSMSLKSPRLRSQVHPVRGSMNSLGEVGGDFDAILSINSLQWSTDWRGVIDEIDEVLSDDEGSRVYAVIGSVRSSDGSESETIGAGLVADHMIDEFEERGLYPLAIGEVRAIGQFGLPVGRNYSVFERRETPLAPWEERIDSGELPFTIYTFQNNGITKQEL